ncbi:MAG: hypothetical protein L6416_11245 [Candidatus Omnitrophica bacterium]|nr:hypothetical protein [Candidatus Omnitrophota bacterium]
MNKLLVWFLVIVNLFVFEVSLSTALAEVATTSEKKDAQNIKSVYNSNIVGVIEQMLRGIGKDYWEGKEKKVDGQITIGENGFNIYLGQDAIDNAGKSGLFLKNFSFTNPLASGNVKFVKGQMVLQEVGKGFFRFSTKLLPGIRADTDTHSYSYNGTDWIESELLP